MQVSDTKSAAESLGKIVFALVVWGICVWMYWMVTKFAGGNTWWDFGVKLVLFDLILAMAIFGLALIAHACFPSRTQKLLETSGSTLSRSGNAILVLFFVALFFVSLILPLLMHFKVIA